MGQIHVARWAKICASNGRCQNTTGVREEDSKWAKMDRKSQLTTEKIVAEVENCLSLQYNNFLEVTKRKNKVNLAYFGPVDSETSFQSAEV